MVSQDLHKKLHGGLRGTRGGSERCYWGKKIRYPPLGIQRTGPKGDPLLLEEVKQVKCDRAAFQGRPRSRLGADDGGDASEILHLPLK